MSERPLDPDSLRYVDHWEPVLWAPARRVLERMEVEPATFFDLGAGTGSLSLVAAERWPSARIVALDASGAMLAVARSRLAASGIDPLRFEWLTADAADIPLDDATVDAVASSFVLQLVPDRPAVLAEAHRVLRAGGQFSFVTWLADDLLLPADEAYHEVIGDLAGDDEDEGFRSPRSGDYRSLDQAADELAAAGFEVIEVVPDELRYAWTAESYLAFKTGYDDHERFDSLDGIDSERLHEALVERLSALPAEDFVVRGPLVAAVARKP